MCCGLGFFPRFVAGWYYLKAHGSRSAHLLRRIGAGSTAHGLLIAVESSVQNQGRVSSKGFPVRLLVVTTEQVRCSQNAGTPTKTDAGFWFFTSVLAGRPAEPTADYGWPQHLKMEVQTENCRGGGGDSYDPLQSWTNKNTKYNFPFLFEKSFVKQK